MYQAKQEALEMHYQKHICARHNTGKKRAPNQCIATITVLGGPKEGEWWSQLGKLTHDRNSVNGKCQTSIEITDSIHPYRIKRTKNTPVAQSLSPVWLFVLCSMKPQLLYKQNHSILNIEIFYWDTWFIFCFKKQKSDLLWNFNWFHLMVIFVNLQYIMTRKLTLM